MGGSKSAYAEQIVLDMFLGAVDYTPPVTVYVALSTNVFDPIRTGGGIDEVAAGLGYDRVAVTNDATQWPAATGEGPASKTNGADIAFPDATDAWGTVTSAYLLDAATAGNVLYGADLTAPIDVVTGPGPVIAAGTYVVTEL